MNAICQPFNPQALNFEVPLILRTDSYKLAHFEQLAEGLEYSYVYLESRYGIENSMFFGLQYILKRYLSQRITREMVDQCEDFALRHGLSFNRKGWMKIVKKFNGHLPLEVKALPEGTVAGVKTPLMVVTNTHKDFAWLPMYFEALLQRVWYSCTVATRSFEQKLILKEFANETVDDEMIATYLMFALHDFGARGVNTAEGAQVGGMSHLVNFEGSDTLEGLWTAEQAYGTKSKMPGYSVYAIEHNVVLSWGESREKELFSSLIQKYVTQGKIVSILPDTFDTFRALDYWAELKDELIAAWEQGGKNGRVVIRPDSGHPVEMPIAVIQRLMEIFGYTINSKGYKVLPQYIRVIQGDGTDKEVIRETLTKLKDLGISAENIVFGQGGKLLQAHGRDDGGYAMKGSVMTIGGIDIKTSKRPKTDPNKRSKEGFFCVTIDEDTGESTWRQVENKHDSGLLESVWYEGNLRRDQSFDEVRDIARGFEEFFLQAA